jgi:DtxR family Mn-dependent transcriptional regulator
MELNEMSLDLSPTMRDYLAQVYRLSEQGNATQQFVSTSSLAEMLDVSAPAVNRMVTKLREMNLLFHEPYQGIRLTEAGKREALKYLRRHRICEAFLVNVMGFKWHEVHDEADRMSRALTEPLVVRMSEMAGDPTRCPHGEPIPDADGNLPDLHDMIMVEAPLKTDLELTRVHTREPDRLEYLAALGLVPGAHLQILNIAPFNGPIQLKLGKEFRIVGHNLAETLRVRLLD